MKNSTNVPRKQRLILYRDALQMISSKQSIKNHSLSGLCKTLAVAAKKREFTNRHNWSLCSKDHLYYQIDKYPEVYNRRPRGLNGHCFWWKEMDEPKSNGIAPRKKILRAAIAEIEKRLATGH